MGIKEVIQTHRTLGHKAFMEKFKEGISNITPLEQAKLQQNSTLLSFIGVVCGLVASVVAWKSTWWLFIILLGGAGITIVQLIGGWQKIKLLNDFENFGSIAEEEVETCSKMN